MGGSPSKQEKATKAVPKSKNLPEAQGQIVEQNHHAVAEPLEVQEGAVCLLLEQSSRPRAVDTVDLNRSIIVPQVQQEKSLATKLRELYKSQDTLPKLIDADEIPQQSLEQYYIKLQIVLNQDSEKKAAAHDKVVGEKQSVEIENIFSAVGESKEANKLLIVGAAGVGKTTLLHYMSYRWGKGDLWGDKFDYVFRVKLKELLSPTWKIGYKSEELNHDELGCFLHYCLGHDAKTLNIQAFDIMAIANKNKVLLLLDGYDEVAHLAGNRYYQEIMASISDYQNVVMSSRPNALNDQMREKFDRQVENQGLGFEGTKKYIDIHFGGHGEESLKQQLTSFLTTNSQVAEMCQIPINLALVSLVWRDPKTREQLTSNEGFNLGKLYEEVVVWLGKRYLEKFAGKSHQEAENLSNEQIFLQPEMEFLTKVAHDSFVRTGKLVEKEVIKENLHSHKIELTKVNKWGLMKPEGEGTKLLDMNYQFIHLTFQEYLTAYYLKNQLTSDQAKTQAAIFIGSHRNEPRYLMTLKFLAGLVTASEDQLLVTRFWESVSCNVDGVLELGMEGKISLLMHLLAQSKNKGEFDSRIPNLEQMQKLIDEAIGADFTKWTAQIIASTYLPRTVVEKINSVLKAPLDKVEIKELTAAIEVITALPNRAEFGGKTAIFEQLVRLISEGKDWQLQKFALEKLPLVADASVVAEQLENGLKLVMGLIGDDNVGTVAKNVLIAVLKESPVEQALWLLQNMFNDSKAYHGLKLSLGILPEIVKVKPEVMATALSLLEEASADFEITEATACSINVFLIEKEIAKSLCKILQDMPNKTQSFELLSRAFNNPRADYQLIKPLLLESLPEIVKAKPELTVKSFELLSRTLNDPKADRDLKQASLKSLPEIVKAKTELISKAVGLLQQVLNDSKLDSGVTNFAESGLSEIVKAMTNKLEAFTLLQQILNDPNLSDKHKQAAAFSLPEVVKVRTELAGQAFTLLHQILNDPNLSDKHKASCDLNRTVLWSLYEILKVAPELAATGSELLMQILNDPKFTSEHKGMVVWCLFEIVKVKPKLAVQNFKLLQQMLNENKADYHVMKSLVDNLFRIVQAKPKLAVQNFELLQQILNDPDAGVGLKMAAARSLVEIVKVIPELTVKSFELLQQLISEIDYVCKASVASSLSEIVKVMPELAVQSFELLQQLLNDPKVCHSSLLVGGSFVKIVQAKPELAAKSFELLQQLLNGPKRGYEFEEVVAKSMPEVIRIMPFDKSLTLLYDHSPEVRSAAKKGMLAKLKEPVDYKDINHLIRIIEHTAKSTEQDDQALNLAALKALKNIANNIDEDGIKWVNEHFSELPDIDATRIFLKVLFHQTLSDGKITEIESQFLIKAILKYGFTAVINPAASKIIFEDVAYKLQENGEVMLEQIALEILEHSEDPLVTQYRTHQPLFRNTGSALPVAAVDIYDGSIIDGTELEHNHWQLWLLNLSDHNKSEPTKSFLLLEKRAEDGRHIIHKLEVQDGKLQNLEFTELPQNVGSELRHKVFGDMEYVKVAPRYYGSVFKVSLQDGDRLIAHAKEEQLVAGANEYEIMRGVLASFAQSVAWQAAGWQEYSSQGGCKIFDKVAAFKLTSEKAEEVRRNSAIIKGQIKLMKQQEQMGERINKLESLQKEANGVIEALKSKINFSEDVREKEKKAMQNRIEEIAQRLPELANQVDLEKVIAGMKGLLSEGEITKQRLEALEEDVDSMLDRQEQMEGRVNKLESLQKEATGTIEALKNMVNSNETIKEREKKAMQNRIEEIAQRLPDLVNQADLGEIIAGIKDLLSQGEAITKKQLTALEDNIDDMVAQQDKHEQKLKLHGKAILDLKSHLSLLEETSLAMVKQVEEDRNLNQSEKAEIKDAIASLKASVAEVSGKMADYDPVFGHIIEDMHDLMARKELDTRAIMILRKKVKEFEQTLNAEATKVSMLHEVVYDNKLLNYPELFNAILKIFGTRGLDLSCNLDPELLQQAINQQDPELLLAGMASLDKAYSS